MTERPADRRVTDWHVPQQVLTGYAAGRVRGVGAWSIESHLSGCLQCRAAVSAQVDLGRLARNRAVVLGLVALPQHGPVAGVLGRLGVPEHLLRLLIATPSLRRSWLLSVLGVLLVVAGEAALARWSLPGAAHPPGAAALHDAAASAAPLLLAGPLLVLASVAMAYLPMFDPSYRLALAAPLSWFTLLLVRAVSAVAVTLVPVVCVSFVVPGPGWLPVAVLLPALALCAFALAGSHLLGPVPAAIAAGTAWVVAVAAASVSRSPLTVVYWPGQALCAAVVVTSVCWLLLDRTRFDMGWAQ